jgi:nicotinate-nucleotide adenylyltransferase
MVGLFGGSFDPIHHGHLLVAQAVMEALGLEGVRFVPARQQPFKHGRHAASAEQRARMVELAIAGDPRFALERAELDRAGPSYTVETLRALRVREPGVEFALLVGADAASELPTWREGDEIPRLARVVAFARAGAAAPAGTHVWRTVAVPAIDISATAIRDRVRAGRPIRYWVPDAVAGYVAAERLYLGAR